MKKGGTIMSLTEKTNPADVKDVADYIVMRSIQKDKLLTNLHLQKYLYFVQAYFMLKTGQLLFTEPFEKWKMGPVVKSVHETYKYYTGHDIDAVSQHESLEITDRKVEFKTVPFDPDNLDKDIKQGIDYVINNLDDYPYSYLIDLTTVHTAWKSDEKSVFMGKRLIHFDYDKMFQYFSETDDAKIWNHPDVGSTRRHRLFMNINNKKEEIYFTTPANATKDEIEQRAKELVLDRVEWGFKSFNGNEAYQNNPFKQDWM